MKAVDRPIRSTSVSVQERLHDGRLLFAEEREPSRFEVGVYLVDVVQELGPQRVPHSGFVFYRETFRACSPHSKSKKEDAPWSFSQWYIAQSVIVNIILDSNMTATVPSEILLGRSSCWVAFSHSSKDTKEG